MPRDQLRERTIELAEKLARLPTHVVHGAKVGIRHARLMSWDVAEDYLYAKLDQTIFVDPDRSRAEGLTGFLDRKSYRPGLEPPAAGAET